MNRKQLKAMWIGIGVIVLMGLFPPWGDTLGINGVGTFRGYGCLATGGTYTGTLSAQIQKEFPDADPTFTTETRVDTTRLLIQCVVVALITAGAVVSYGKRKE